MVDRLAALTAKTIDELSNERREAVRAPGLRPVRVSASAMRVCRAPDIEAVEWRANNAGGGGTGGRGRRTDASLARGGGSGSGSNSSAASCSNCSGDICRICHCESDAHNPLLAPCYCSGSLKYVHQSCLQQWLTASDTRSCELCKFNFIMHTKIKPFNEWRSLEMSGVERRRLCCAVLFHCVAALCVMWSLFVLIDRAAEEIQRGLIGWPFWTKLVVVAVGFTGGAVFMYIQCRQYFTLCSRWRCHNRILLIQNAPEKIHVAPPSPVIHHLNIATSSSSRGRREASNDLDRANHGQIVANIENNPSVSNSINAATSASRQSINEQLPMSDNRSYTSAVFPPSSSVFAEEEDESGGFNDYRPNSFRRILTNDNRNYSIVPLDKDAKILNRSQDSVDIRRYSDTRLLQTFDSRHALGLKVMDNVPHLYQASPNDRRLSTSQQSAKKFDPTSQSEECINDATVYSPYGKAVYHIPDSFDPSVDVVSQYEEHPQVSDIVFDNSSHNYDPLELNIQEMLELDVKTAQQRKKSVLSLNRDQPVQCHRVNNYEANKSVFKSLPNLSASSESLLPHKNNS